MDWTEVQKMTCPEVGGGEGRIKKMKPHVFKPSKNSGFPGLYCLHCHYSVDHANPKGCPKRYHWPRAKKITDKVMLDWLLTPGHDLGVRDLNKKYHGMLWFDHRKDIRAAILSERRARRGR